MLTLASPSLALMPFRQALLADPATMAYNAPYYPPDGTLSFPESAWTAWLTKWAEPSADRFCAYLMDGETPVGEVSWHDGGAGMGIVIKSEYRGRGFGAEGLRLLLAEAFEKAGLLSLRNDFETDRQPAMAMHLAAGFVPMAEKDGITTVILTRDAYIARKRAAWIRQTYDAMCAYECHVPGRIHHLVKVHSFARQIALHEKLDADTLFTLEIAALTHDIGIKPAEAQYGHCAGPLQERLGPPEAVAMLGALGLPQDVIDRVCFLIGHHHTVTGVDAIDWRILLEADFLVNMIESNYAQAAIDKTRDTVFQTAEGKRLLEQIRPEQ